MGSRSIKISTDLVELARAETARTGRSINGQIEYWAKLGREIEHADLLTHKQILELLSEPVPAEPSDDH